MMKQAVFITGFNNWGKTSIIQHLFSNRKRFYFGWHYNIAGINTRFTVESHSNDDLWGEAWSNLVQRRIDEEMEPDLNLITALCPTMHDGNNFVDLLSGSPFTGYDKLHIFLVELKWEHHAQLLTDNIIAAGRNIPNSNFVRINADRGQSADDVRWSLKTAQVYQELIRIFP